MSQTINAHTQIHINLIGVRVRVATRILNKNGYVPTGKYASIFDQENAAILQNTWHGIANSNSFCIEPHNQKRK